MLLVFDSRIILEHLADKEDPSIIETVFITFFNSVIKYLRYKNKPNWQQYIDEYIESEYFNLIIEDSNIVKNVIDEESGVIDRRTRFKELIDICISEYKDELFSSLVNYVNDYNVLHSLKMISYDKFKLVVLMEVR